jgi:hypothetical protein
MQFHFQHVHFKVFQRFQEELIQTLLSLFCPKHLGHCETPSLKMGNTFWKC